MPHALIVDDDPEVLAAMAEVVRGEGFTVATADSLRAARAQLVRQQPEVLLTDLQLPDGKGTELAPGSGASGGHRVRGHHRPRQRGQRGEGAAPGRGRLPHQAGGHGAAAGVLRRRAVRPASCKRRDRRAAPGAAQASGASASCSGAVAGHAAGLRQDRARRADRGHGAAHRRERAPARSWWRATDPRAEPRASAARSWRSTAARSRRSLIESELFGHEKGASPAPTASTRATSSAPTAARCSSTRSPRCRSSCRSSCCACSRRGTFRASAAREQIASTCASSRPPTAIRDAGGGRRASSARTCYYRLNVFPIDAAAAARARERHRAARRALPRATSTTHERHGQARSRRRAGAAAAATTGRATCAS